MSRLNGLAGWLVAAASVCALFVTSALSGPTTPSQIDGCVYNATPPTLSDGQTAVFQCGSDGKLNVSASVSITNPTIGAAVPATAVYVAGSKGGLLTGLLLDGSGYLDVNCQTGCSGGTFNNNADNVATSASNGQSAAWLYGWDGAAWDRLYTGAGTEAQALRVTLPTDGTGAVIAKGASADDAAASGNPVPVGGIYNTTLPTYSNLDRTQIQFGSRGSMHIELWGSDSTNAVGVLSAGGDDVTNAQNILLTGSKGYIFDGTAWDRTLEIVTGTNSTGGGIQAVGQVGQCDDTAPQLITENQFGNALIDCTNHTTVVGGLVTTAAPSYTTATSRGVSLTTAGGLREDLATIAGTTADTNSGTKSAGTLRVVLATDQPALTNKLLVTPDSVALPANQSVNVSQMNAVTVLMGNGVTGTGSQRVTIASDNTPFGIKGAVTPADAAALGTTAVTTFSYNGIYNGSTVDLQREVANGTNSTGAGIPMHANVAQCDDTSQTAITENSFGNQRIECATHAAVATLVPSATAGGLTLSTLTLANSTNATNVKASAGQLYAISGFNMSSATPVWVSLYNNAGTPTCGTGIVYQFLIPGSTTGAGFVHEFTVPLQFATGIAYCATTGIAGTGSVAATTYVVNFGYK